VFFHDNEIYENIRFLNIDISGNSITIMLYNK